MVGPYEEYCHVISIHHPVLKDRAAPPVHHIDYFITVSWDYHWFLDLGL